MSGISGSVIKDLKKYLLAHEFDIYCSANDFGELAHAFRVIVGREPKEQCAANGEVK